MNEVKYLLVCVVTVVHIVKCEWPVTSEERIVIISNEIWVDIKSIKYFYLL